MTTATHKPSTQKVRTVERVLFGKPTSDGAGVQLKRMIGTTALMSLDPFLMFDEFRSDQAQDYIAGFPSHPHRGFQTVTYMLEGLMRHQDSNGQTGLLRPGGIQWMNAGRGIIHSEMPEQDNGMMWGFQLWINLPAAEKMSPASYQDYEPEQVPLITLPSGATVRVIAGATSNGIDSDAVLGAVKNIITDPLYLDVRLPQKDMVFEQSVPVGHAAFVYLYQGDALIEGQALKSGELAVLETGDAVRLSAESEDAKFLLVAAKPIGEPIVQRGPFVMNTLAEIHQANQDYLTGRFLSD